jgi:hypothetical protein
MTLIRSVLKRSMADWPVVVGGWLLLLCATTVIAAGALYSEAVAVEGLRRTIETAPPADRNVLVWTSGGRDAGALDASVTALLRPIVDANGGEISRVARDSWLRPADGGPPIDNMTGFAGHDALAAHARLADGRWPEPGGNPIQGSLAVSVAREAGLVVGDRLRLVDPRDPARILEVQLTATWEPVPGDPYWHTIDGDEARSLDAGRGPIVVPLQDVIAVGGSRLGFEWRVLPSSAGLDIADVAPLQRAIETLQSRITAAAPSATFTVRSGLPPLLDATGRAVLVSRGGVLVLVAQFAILATYAISLVAGILLDRRRAGLALLEARGAGIRQTGALALGEAVLLALPTVILAPILSVALVRALGALGPLAGTRIGAEAVLGPLPVAAALVAVGAGIAGLVIPALLPRGATAGMRAAINRPSSRTLPQRLGLDLALVALAAVGLWQLRLYGALLTRDARGALGIDPLLGAAPAMGLLAGGVLAVRIVPRLADLAERALLRRSGLVLSLGAQQVARRPLRYTRSAMLLMLAAALGTFAALYAATWSRSQIEQGAYRSAADVRVIGSAAQGREGTDPGALYRGIDGVLRVTSVVRQPIDLGRSLRGGELVAVAPESVSELHAIPPSGALPDWHALAGLLTDARPTNGVALPDGSLAIVVDLDTQLAVEGGGGRPPDLSATALVLDAEGRILRLGGGDVEADAAAQRVEIPLDRSDGERPLVLSAPLRLLGIELVAPAPDAPVTGSFELQSIDAVSGTDRTETRLFEPGADGWSWTWGAGAALTPLPPLEGEPGTIRVGEPGLPLIGGEPGATTVFRLWMAPQLSPALPVVAGRSFAERIGATIGDVLNASAGGQVLAIEIVGIVDAFAPLDPTAPFVLVDAGTLDALRFTETGQPMPTAEWWLDTTDGAEAAVLAAVRALPVATENVLGREELARANATDPLGLGIIGALALGAIAAALVGAIGFLVSASISTSERLDEFAILRALGLSSGQLTAWLTAELAFLLLLGVAFGAGLGIALGWLVLPFATLTTTGLPPVPEPAIVVPWDVLLPLYGLVVALLVVTLLIIRRQLATVRIGEVLRGQEA